MVWIRENQNLKFCLENWFILKVLNENKNKLQTLIFFFYLHTASVEPLNVLQMLEIDSLRVNLRLDGVLVRELFEVNWRYESGLVTNIEQMVEEYRQIRGLEVQHCLAIKHRKQYQSPSDWCDSKGVKESEIKKIKIRKSFIRLMALVVQQNNGWVIWNELNTTRDLVFSLACSCVCAGSSCSG